MPCVGGNIGCDLVEWCDLYLCPSDLLRHLVWGMFVIWDASGICDDVLMTISRSWWRYMHLMDDNGLHVWKCSDESGM